MGKYDALTGRTVDKVWDFIHSIEEFGERDVLYKLKRYNRRQLSFNLKLAVAIKTEDCDKPFLIDGAVIVDRKMPVLEIDLLIYEKHGKLNYNKLNARLNEVIRHEIEHLTQSGLNKKKGKPHVGNSKRIKILFKKKSSYLYYSLVDEIPALAHGMSRQSKVEKRPITEVFIEYLKMYIDEKEISEKEAKLLFQKWYNYSKVNLPKAIYAQKEYR